MSELKGLRIKNSVARPQGMKNHKSLVTSQSCREHQGSGGYDAAINGDNVTGYP